MANIKLSDLEADSNTLLTAIATGDFLLVHDISETVDVRKIKVISAANFLKLVTETARQAIVASQAAGDIFYASSATALTRLAKGASGTVLTMGTSVPKWVAPVVPGDGCCLFKSSVQAISEGVWTPVLFSDEYWDDASYHSVSTNTSRITFTAATAGRYLVSAYCTFYSVTSGTVYIGIRKNGSPFICGQGEAIGSLGHGPQINLSFVYEFVNGDYIEVIAYQNCQGSLDLQVSNPPLFSVAKLR